MADLSVDGLDELVSSIADIAELPGEVAAEMLGAEAKIVIARQKATGSAMGVRDTGLLLDSIRQKPAKKTKDGYSVQLSFSGSRRRGNRSTKNSEIAFINEFGKRGQPARPFIKTANEQSADEAAEAAARVYEAWLAKQGL